jgi:TonB family protein
VADLILVRRMKRSLFLSLVVLTFLPVAIRAENPHRVHVTAVHDMPTRDLRFRVVSGVTAPPKLIRGLAPVYSLPPIGWREDGFATISCTVDVTGRTRGFRVVKASRPYFARDAIAALEKWTFQPAMKGDRPWPCEIEVPFLFRLHP